MQAILAMLALSTGLGFGPEGAVAAPPAVEVYTTTRTIPTYPYADYLEMHHSSAYNVDYLWLNWSQYDGSGPVPAPQNYAAIVVENSWLRLTFLPELGGRLYGVTVKSTGEEFLYQNPVIKPTHWGPAEQGWWLAAGGLEWCLPVEEHGYEWAIPWPYSISTTSQGATVTVWDTESNDRLRAQIAVHLLADRAVFQIMPRLENPTGAPVSFRFWENAMLAPGAANTVGPDLRFVLPIDQVTVHSRGDSYLPEAGEAMDWPIYHGTDYSRLGNWNRWLGFFARPQAAEDWAGLYDESAKRGLARVFPHQVATGLKGFGMGWHDALDWHLWTDDGSTYAELHSGPSPTFWDSMTLGPGQALEWTETWLPLQDLPALSLATADAALGLKAVGADLHFGFQVAGQHADLDARLWRQADCAILWQADDLSPIPGMGQSHTLAGQGLSEDQVVLTLLEDGNPLATSEELTCLPPTSQVDELDAVQTSTGFAVTWSATDLDSTLAGYDVQVRDGDADAAWTGWLTATMLTTAPFVGQSGHTYSFRSRARDAFGRLEDWPTGNWQDAFTTVLLQPAPVLITSSKHAEPESASPGEGMAFEIHLANTGNLEASVTITDPLPAYLTLGGVPWSSHPPPPMVVDDTIHWSGTLAAGQTDVTIGFEARLLELPPGGVISNCVWIDGGGPTILRRQATAIGRQRVYLPLAVKDLVD